MSIQVQRLTKSFGKHLVVNQVSFEVAKGECFVLLGPSGSGKSTVLRLLAGLAEPDAGRILIEGRDVATLRPQDRQIGFVFQQYALFGHMTVADNVEFALKIRHVAGRQRETRRAELLELVGLVGLDRRYPHQLSGGQQQRVALARALAHQPNVLLLDEPFGALDARIRTELRRTLKTIQRELSVTTLFVTHDQEEAFELADHLGVMNFGNLLETGAPQELYLRPQTEFAATFLGRANLLVGESQDGGWSMGPLRLSDGTARTRAARRRVQLLFRPEDVAIKTSAEALDWPAVGEGVVEDVGFIGSVERIRVRLPGIRGVRPIAPPARFGTDDLWLDAQRSQHLAARYPIQVGDRVHVGVRRVHALAHPGLSFLVALTDPARLDEHLQQVGHLARQTHARVHVFLPDAASDAAALERRVRDRLGSGLAALQVRITQENLREVIAREAARQPHDLLIAPRSALRSVDRAQHWLRSGRHHLLLLDSPDVDFRQFVLCVAAGEPAKSDVRFCARLVRHLGAKVEVLTVARPDSAEDAIARIDRFQRASQRTFALFGVESRARVERGEIVDYLRQSSSSQQVLVMGAPLWNSPEPLRIRGALASVLEANPAGALLVIRSDLHELGDAPVEVRGVTG